LIHSGTAHSTSSTTSHDTAERTVREQIGDRLLGSSRARRPAAVRQACRALAAVPYTAPPSGGPAARARRERRDRRSSVAALWFGPGWRSRAGATCGWSARLQPLPDRDRHFPFGASAYHERDAGDHRWPPVARSEAARSQRPPTCRSARGAATRPRGGDQDPAEESAVHSPRTATVASSSARTSRAVTAQPLGRQAPPRPLSTGAAGKVTRASRE
jgi:hypothetical protein